MRIAAPEKPMVTKMVAAAIPLFAVKGLAAVSVKELADAAGVNIAMVSYYFGGKENLYAYALKSQLVVFMEELNRINNGESSPVEKLRRFAVAGAKLHDKCPYFPRLVYGEIINPTLGLEDAFEKEILAVHDLLSGWIRDGVAAGLFRSGLDPDFAAVSLASIIHVYFITQHRVCKMLPAGPDQAEQYLVQAIDIYLRGTLVPQLPGASAGMDGIPITD